MTAQGAEWLRYRGEELEMFANPLESYFELIGERPMFQRRSTACLRGYTASWDVIDDRLYLVDLHGYLKDGTPLSVATFFPETPATVFASWFSDTVQVPEGEMLKGEDVGYESIFERDLLITFNSGIVAHVDMRHNQVPPREILDAIPVRAGGWRRLLSGLRNFRSRFRLRSIRQIDALK